jgi:hypothetical protein
MTKQTPKHSSFHRSVRWDRSVPNLDGFLLVGTCSIDATIQIGHPTKEYPRQVPDAGKAVEALVNRLALQVLEDATKHLCNQVPEDESPVLILRQHNLSTGELCEISKQQTADGATITVTIRNPKPEEKTS